MTEIKIAWLAGLLEGEACFTHGRNQGYPLVTLGMTDRDTIEKAAEIHPGASFHVVVREDRKELYQLRWCGPIAVDLMNTVLPYMGSRRTARINEVISDWMTYRTRTCPECGEQFIRPATPGRHTYCNTECATNARNRQNRQYRSRA